jgi:hypothetical protein
LPAYVPDLRELWRRAIGYVDRVLKGANPADLPIQLPGETRVHGELEDSGDNWTEGAAIDSSARRSTAKIGSCITIVYL